MRILFLKIFSILAQKQPNVLVILLDDLGWADVGWNNLKAKTTPNLDKIARKGTILVSFIN